MPLYKQQILKEHQAYRKGTGGRITDAKEMIIVIPEKKGYEAALELAVEDVKNTTKFVKRISKLSPYKCYGA